MLKRHDGKPLSILIRGDCTCRRSLALNLDLFETKPRVVQNEKSPTVMFLEALQGRSVSKEYLTAVSDIESMSPTLRHFYLSQAGRSVLYERDVDLLMIDSYADMNFELWENDAGETMWMHHAHLRNRGEFLDKHRSIGRSTLQQSVDNIVEFIDRIRVNNPNVPVLLLNQQVEFYPKLESRLEFYQLGELVAKRVPNAFFGGVVPMDALELADVGSCGPGKTLHFQGSTYRKMLNSALDAGLRDAIDNQTSKPSIVPPVANEPAEDINPTERAEIVFSANTDECIASCSGAIEKAHTIFANYFKLPERNSTEEPRFTPMLIPADSILDFQGWEDHIKTFGKGARLRQKKKALARGYYAKPFAWRMFIPDIHAANNSKAMRSGGALRANLLSTVEELGGAPSRHHEIPLPQCRHHWRMTFGVFKEEPGHMQGKVQVDERLVAYISLRRTGEVVLYAQILGHGDHLDSGILTLLHHDVIRWISENIDGYTKGLKYVMYGGAQNGTADLLRFKRQAGFVSCQVTARR